MIAQQVGCVDYAWWTARLSPMGRRRCKGSTRRLPDGDSLSGLVPRSWTAEEEYDALTKLLLKRDADVNSKDNNSQTPLLWAMRGGHDAVVKQLLEKGAAGNTKDSTQG